MRTSVQWVGVWAAAAGMVQPALAGRRVGGHGLSSGPSVNALLPPGYRGGAESAGVKRRADGVPLVGNGTFDQWIDHTRPEAGCFRQRYWYNATNWAGAGSPVVVHTFGIDDYADEDTAASVTEGFMPGMIAKEVGGAQLMVELRYFGEAYPFDIYNATTLQYLEIAQIVADFARIARELDLPFDSGHSSNVPNAPWIWAGAGFASTLSLWIERLAPDVFWASHASSSSTEAIYDWWQYAVPIHQGMPQNCSADLSAIYQHIDDTFMHGDPQQQQDLKDMFLLGDLSDPVDFGYAVANPIRAWDQVYFFGDFGGFYNMCDAIEGVSNSSDSSTYPTGTGLGLEQALPNYAKWFTEQYLPGTCDPSAPLSTACFDYSNATSPRYAHTPDNRGDFAFQWTVCSWPLYGAVSGPPQDLPGPVPFPRITTADANQASCAYYFPEGGWLTPGPMFKAGAYAVNAYTGGWDFTGTDRIYHSRGQFDSWATLSPLSQFRPQGPFRGTPETPAVVIPGASYSADYYKWAGLVNSDVAAIQDTILAQFKNWTAEFYASK